MAIQISLFNLHSKQKNIRYIYEEDKSTEIFSAQRKLENEASCCAFVIVLTEQV